jgi:uncharacterized protein YutE (UPF0331/DUF86 family)
MRSSRAGQEERTRSQAWGGRAEEHREVKLGALQEHLGRLRRRRPATPDALRDDVDLQDAIAMSLLVCVQTALDIAVHDAADAGLGLPSTYAESFRLLGEHGVIRPPTADAMARMAALRDRIAHGYGSVNFARIWSELPDGVQAFDEFAAAIAGRLGGA